MPFTLSHPAAILPLGRSRYLLFLPLIAGSIAPDLQYFLPEALSGQLPDSHTLFGAIVICPIAALLWLGLVRVLRHALTSPLSGRHRTLLENALERFGATPGDWLAAIPAISVGVMLHLLWDSFTHSYGWPVREFPPLRATISLMGQHMLVFHALQWLSSIFGLGAIAAVYHRALLALPIDPAPKAVTSGRISGLLFIALTALGVAALRISTVGPPRDSVYGMAFVGSIAAIDTFAVLYVAFGIYLNTVSD